MREDEVFDEGNVKVERRELLIVERERMKLQREGEREEVRWRRRKLNKNSTNLNKIIYLI